MRDCVQPIFILLFEDTALYTGVILEGDVGEVISENCPTSPFFKLREKYYRKNIPKDYHFSSKLQKAIKTSPCFQIYRITPDTLLS